MSTFETRSGRGLAIVAMVVAALLGLLAVLFGIGETFDDPGGWTAAGLVAVWFVPLAALLALALVRPSVAEPVLWVLTAAWVGVVVWSMVAPDTWRSFEDDTGPVRAFACLVLMLPVAALGWHRPLPAAAMLLVIGVSPLFAVGSAPLQVMAMPTLVVGLLLLAAGLVERAHRHGSATGPPSLPTPHAA